MTAMSLRRVALLVIAAGLLIACAGYAAGRIDHDSAVTAGLFGGLTIVLILIAAVGARARERRWGARVQRQRELRELLQASGTESESRQLLIRHVQRLVPGSAAAVLHRDENEDRLEATLAGPVLTGPLAHIRTEHLRRSSCMAVRLGRPYERHPGNEPLLQCEVCGEVTGEIACKPLLVDGQVTGSVLVVHDRAIGSQQRSELGESIVEAAPILANQRKLELAEWRAACDPLTGLPNRRAAEETMRRMAAHAGRTLTPLGALMVDLDRFQQINDRHGHDDGDKALAIIGQVLAASVRASDFAARYGGEEFLVLLPDTGRTGAIEVAEKVRHAIEHAELPVVGALTASIGVAAIPEDAVEPGQMIHKAGRALYVAKARGRNRVEAALGGAGEPRADGDDLLGGGEMLGS
jgi:diguanylate cyclase (GGDEF)-like protein